MTTTDELKARLGGYAFLHSFTDAEFESFTNYSDGDFGSLYDLPIPNNLYF